MIVNQWVPSAHYGDAIGDHIRATRDLFRPWGHDSDIFAVQIDEALEGDVPPWTDEARATGDVTILHFAGASPMTAAVRRAARAGASCSTTTSRPRRFFAPYEPGLAREAAAGRKELATLAGAVDLAVGVSDYNRRELRVARVHAGRRSCRFSWTRTDFATRRGCRRSSRCSRTA